MIFHLATAKLEAKGIYIARAGSEQWFHDVIVFSQPCYDRSRAKIYNAALTREFSTFANVREEIC